MRDERKERFSNVFELPLRKLRYNIPTSKLLVETESISCVSRSSSIHLSGLLLGTQLFRIGGSKYAELFATKRFPEDTPIRKLPVIVLCLLFLTILTFVLAHGGSDVPTEAQLEFEVNELKAQTQELRRSAQNDRLDTQLAIIAETLMQTKRAADGKHYERLEQNARGLRIRHHLLRSSKNNEDAMKRLLGKVGAFGIRLSKEAEPLPALAEELLKFNEQLQTRR